MGSDSTEKVTQVRKRALFGMCNVVMALSFFALVARFSSSSYSAHSAIRRGLRKFGVTRHCYIVRQSLFGNHETDREHATLNWWNDAALLSIHRAAEWAGAEVHVIMSLSDAYTDYQDNFPKQSTDFVKVHSHVPKAGFFTNTAVPLSTLLDDIVTESQCKFVTVTRLDSDDMLNLEYFEKVTEDAYSKGDLSDKIVLSESEWREKLYLHTNEKGNMECKLKIQDKHKHALTTLGAAATTTTANFVGGVSKTIEHFCLSKGKLATVMQHETEKKISVHSVVHKESLGTFCLTPLSSHYVDRSFMLDTCTAEELNKLPASTRDLVFSVSSSVPSVNNAMSREGNVFMQDTFDKVVERRKKKWHSKGKGKGKKNN